ncbi:hypothetical protein [Silanimonas sp.]|uniref:hypothetical protein n=1 Tax=Silanimonas sp. TaxID=1929290 RepID=UPI0022CABACE|nr:hypothetical protein [Silanimonas sp.]MCZ8164978.1 hypothetical protein [Silanimonas sp.]
MARRYRRSSSPVSDVAASSRRGPWWKPLAIGVFAFLLFGVVYPLIVLHLLADADAGILRPVLDQVLGRQWHRAFLIGTACLLLGAGLSAWKYWRQEALSHGQLQDASFLSRLLARFMT